MTFKPSTKSFFSIDHKKPYYGKNPAYDKNSFVGKKPYYGKNPAYDKNSFVGNKNKKGSRRSFKKHVRRILFISSRFFKLFLNRKSRFPLFKSAKRFSFSFFVTQPQSLWPSAFSAKEFTNNNFPLFSKKFSAEALQTIYSRRLSKRFLRAYIKTYRLSFYDKFARTYLKTPLKSFLLKTPTFVKSPFRPFKALASYTKVLSFLRLLALRRVKKDKKLKKFLGVKRSCLLTVKAKVKVSRRQANKKFFMKLLNDLAPNKVAVAPKAKSRKLLVFRRNIQRLPKVFLRPTSALRRLSRARFKAKIFQKILRNCALRTFLLKSKLKFLSTIFKGLVLKKFPKSKKKFARAFVKISAQGLRYRFGNQRTVRYSKASLKAFQKQPPLVMFPLSPQDLGLLPKPKEKFVRKSFVDPFTGFSFHSSPKDVLPQPKTKGNFLRKSFGAPAVSFPFFSKDLKKKSWSPVFRGNNLHRSSLRRLPQKSFPARIFGPRSLRSSVKSKAKNVSHYFSRSLFKPLQYRRFVGRLKLPKPRLLVSLLRLKRRSRFRPSLKRQKKSSLLFFLKNQLKILKVNKVQKNLIFNRFSFQFHGASRQRKIWISSLIHKKNWAFKSLGIFLRKFRALKRNAQKGFALDFSGYGERFRWPSRISWQKKIYPSYLWELVTSKGQGMLQHLSQLASLTKFLTPSTSHRQLLLWLSSWYTKGWGLKLPPSLCGITSPPRFLHRAGFCQKNSPFFFIFWRPLWDTFDKDVLLEDYYKEWPGYNSIWTGLIYKLLGARRTLCSKALSSIFLFQFVDREFRFWSSVFNNLFLMKDFSTDSYPFLKKFTPLVANPVWYLHQLNRLLLVLPFLPKTFRFSFFNNYRVVSFFCLHKFSEKKDLLVDASNKSLERMDYWFKHQNKYFKKLQKKSSRFFFFIRFFKMLRFTVLCRWLGQFKSPLKAQFRRQFKSLFLSNIILPLGKIPVFPLTKLRLSFLRKRNFFRKKFRRFQRPPTVQLAPEYPQSVLLKESNLWRLLLFWSLFFSQRFHFQQKFFHLSQWLLCVPKFYADHPISQSFSLESLWSQILKKSSLLENTFRAACFHWALSKSSPAVYQRQFFRRSVLNCFFFPQSRRESQPIPKFYKRYNYIRKLPFRYFRQFWPQSANFPRLTKFKIYRKSAISSLTPKIQLVHPLAYVSHTPRFYQQLAWGRPSLNNYRKPS